MEGGLAAPVRHPIDWRGADFYDPQAIDAELRRTFDICHGCRRCFNLCDVFPRLFDLIDEAPTGELDSVDSGGFTGVIDACTLCDMCFMTKCPYVPPHEFGLDFPHLMLRHRAAAFKAGNIRMATRQLARTDRNARLARPFAALVNWAGENRNRAARWMIEKIAGIHRRAEVPKFAAVPLQALDRDQPPEVNSQAPAAGRKAVLYATCFINYNEPGIGLAARAVLARNGVDTEVVHPRCCGMPLLEHGDLEGVAEAARAVATELKGWVDRGYEIIALVPSCALMLKFEWPLLLAGDETVAAVAGATRDIAEYVVDIARNEGLAAGLKPLDGGVSLHLACHARAQNMGPKAAEMLRLIPGLKPNVIERCSGHGGAWGMMRENFDTALKIGRPVARRAVTAGAPHVTSECPLAAAHIAQGMAREKGMERDKGMEGEAGSSRLPHPIELMARAYGDGA